jgi:DNA polymerase elongation subunit (family B)
MLFKLIKVDPELCSIEELENEIKRLDSIKEEYFGKEQAIKVFINSIYGACASPWFECYNISVAEAVTLQGQDIIKYTNKILDDYFINYWHLDKKLHEELKLEHVNKINEKSIIIYNDTDSTYMTFEPIIKSCNFEGDVVDFILNIKKLRLNSYIKEKFNEYAKEFNTKNIQDLELEKISYSALMVAKKKYVLDLAWKDPGVRFNPQEKIKPVGIEIQQGSTPKFVRKVLKEMLKLELSKGKDLKYGEVVQKLRDFKKEFMLQDPENISKQQTIGDYEKYVLEDKKEIKLADKAQANNQSAAVHNYLLQNSKYKSKYNLIKTGDKIKWYYAHGDYEIFGFLPNNYPYEFALSVNYDKQFEKMIVEPFNRFIEPLGFNPIPGNLIYSKSLF